MKINNNKPPQMKNAINSASIKRNKSPMIVKQQKIKIKAINFKSNNNIDYAKQDLSEQISNTTNLLNNISETVKEIKVVNEYPATEENGVLYIKLES